MLDLGADAGVMVDCMTWVASEILAPLTSLGSCRQVGYTPMIALICSRQPNMEREVGTGRVAEHTNPAPNSNHPIILTLTL